MTLYPSQLGRSYKKGVTVFVSLCVETPGPDGRAALVPLVARIVRVPPLPATDTAQAETTTAVFPITLPAGVLPPDIKVLLLHKRKWQHRRRRLQRGVGGPSSLLECHCSVQPSLTAPMHSA